MGRRSETFGKSNAIFWGVLVMLSNNLLILPVLCDATNIYSNDNDNGNDNNNNNFGNEKNYYSTPVDPHLVPTPSGTPHGSHHSHSPGSGSGGYYPSPTPTPPSSGGSGGSFNPPLVPSPPISGGGSGGGCSCPTPSSSSPPPTSGGSGTYYPPTTPDSPSTPLVPSPPISITPILPTPPIFPISPPTPFDPNTPPFPCTYWGGHPALIFGVLGWWATLGGIMGVATLPGLSSVSSTSLQQVLNNPRNDGYGSLYREGAASYLNSMATKHFYFNTPQVKNGFLSALSSEKAAAHQARIFKLANEGKLKKIN